MHRTMIFWFRNDLRLRDHEGIFEACQNTDRLIPVFVLDPRFTTEGGRYGLPKMGPFRAKFLWEGLQDLRASLQAKGSDLVILRGKTEEVLADLARREGAEEIWYSEEPAWDELKVESALKKSLEDTEIDFRGFATASLYHPEDLPYAPHEIPKVFTSFRKAVEKKSSLRSPLPVPEQFPPVGEVDSGEMIGEADFGFVFPKSDSRGVLDFRGGGQAAIERVQAYFWEADALKNYKFTRNGLLGADFSSKFSAWLAQGSLSPRWIAAEVARYERERKKNVSTYWLIFELIWRDYFRYWFMRFGRQPFFLKGIHPDKELAWDQNEERFERWKRGETGMPFIDANMRELVLTGFMSNRGRQNVASYLVRDLGLDWRLGAAWFEYQLLDYDVYSNWGNWAYVAGVGADPRDRYFNVLNQAIKYDKKGEYVKHWLPELTQIPASQVHTPWVLNDLEQSAFGCRIGVDYPQPLVQAAAWKKIMEGARY